MEIINANDCVKDFKSFLKSISDYNNMVYNIDSVLKLKNFNRFILIKDNGKIIDFAEIFIKDTLKYIAPNFTYEYKQLEELKLFKQIFPNYILELNKSLGFNQNIYFKCQYDSSINKDFKYKFENEDYYVSNINNIYILRDYFENKYFSELNYEKLSFINIKSYELEPFLKKYCGGKTLWYDKKDWALAGFHYFLPEIDSHSSFLMCLNNNYPIGVIKYEICNNFDIPCQCICYIDVNFAYRNNKISQLLISEMNNYLIDKIPLIITHESDMGKKCHIHKTFKKNINKKIYTYKEMEQIQYNEYIQKFSSNLH